MNWGKVTHPFVYNTGWQMNDEPVVCQGSERKSAFACLLSRLLRRTRHSSGKKDFTGPATSSKLAQPD